jgi:hypothetical protein
MMTILCECDWGVGLKYPHSHVNLERLRFQDGRVFWLNRPAHDMNPDTEVLAEWSEVRITVDWKTLYRESSVTR